MNLKEFVTKLNFLNSVRNLRKKKIKLNEEQIKLIVNVGVFGFLQLWENREREFYKQLNKMKL